MSVAPKKGPFWRLWRRGLPAAFGMSLSLISGGVRQNGPEPSRARRCWARAKRTLDGEDRSEMIAEEGKAGRKIGETWSAILVPSPAASNKRSRAADRRMLHERNILPSTLRYKV